MATIRFVTNTEPVESSNTLAVIQKNQSFLQFVHEQDLGKLCFPELSYIPKFWEHLVNEEGEEVAELDADHDINHVTLRDPKYYWFFVDMIEKYEAGNPRRVVLDCNFHKSEVPERQKGEK